MAAALVIVGGLLVAYSLLQRRLATSPLSGPLLFTGVGVLIGPEGWDLVDLTLDDSGLETLLTATLALVLFADASHIDLTELRRGWRGPARLLGVSFPLMLIAGAGLGFLLFPGLDLFAVLAIATVLAPTDAALGQAVVTNPKVPLAVRQTLSVESGLNDGLALPVLIAVLASAQARGAADPATVLVDELITEVGWGIVVGLGIGGVTAAAVRRAARGSWSPPPASVGLAGVASLAASIGAAEMAGGSVLIASFVVGLVLGPTFAANGEGAFRLSGELVEVLELVAFVVFGGVVLSAELGSLDWRVGLYAALTLVVLRPSTIAIGAVGSGAAAPTVGFVGWFGPRGLASILFVVIVARKSPAFSDFDALATVMTWTVASSVVAHGVTAWPGSNLYGRWAARHPDRIGRGPEGRALPAGALHRDSPPRAPG